MTQHTDGRGSRERFGTAEIKEGAMAKRAKQTKKAAKSPGRKLKKIARSTQLMKASKRTKRSTRKRGISHTRSKALIPHTLKVTFDIADQVTPSIDQFGADSSQVVTPELIATAGSLLGAAPAFWGRYFKGPGNQDEVQYQPHRESEVFRVNNIRVVPIARQTPSVGGIFEEGRRDGLRNGAAVLAGFGAKYLSEMADGVLVFLDVEPETSLSVEYYRGWSEGLVAAGGEEMSTDAKMSMPKVKFLPGLYTKAVADEATIEALIQAVDQGAACKGVWISRQYLDHRRSWDEDFIVPQLLPRGIPVLLWQWMIDWQGLDINLANPALQDDLLNRVVLPMQVKCIQ
jgi:hypothetical protein